MVARARRSARRSAVAEQRGHWQPSMAPLDIVTPPRRVRELRDAPAIKMARLPRLWLRRGLEVPAPFLVGRVPCHVQRQACEKICASFRERGSGPEWNPRRCGSKGRARYRSHRYRSYSEVSIRPGECSTPHRPELASYQTIIPRCVAQPDVNQAIRGGHLALRVARGGVSQTHR